MNLGSLWETSYMKHLRPAEKYFYMYLFTIADKDGKLVEDKTKFTKDTGIEAPLIFRLVLKFISDEVMSFEKGGKLKLKEYPKEPKDGDKCPHAEIIAAFNEICVSLPSVQTISETRKTKLRARYKELGSVGRFRELFRRVEASDFLTGRVRTNRAWKATIDWIISNDNNYVKVFEGKYDNADYGTENASQDATGERERLMELVKNL